MDVVGLELLKGFGRFWLHPLTYIFFLIALYFGIRRVKRERKDFHTRVYDVIHEITFPLLTGLIVGFILSLIFSVTGIEIPYGMIALLFVIWLIMLPFGNMRLLSMTTVSSIALIITLFLPAGGTGFPLIDEWLVSITTMNKVGFAWVIAGLFVAEAVLILINGWKETSPKLIASERGKTVGTHELKRMWLLPILLLIPIGNVSFAGYWPLFSSGIGQGNGFIFVPFVLGSQFSVRREFPDIGVKRIGKILLIVSFIVVLLGGAATVWPILAPAVGMTGVVVREIIFAIHRSSEKHSASIYTNQKEGLTVLGVLPYSTAEKMGIQVGEIILKVNGLEVATQSELYEALQQNSAFCKLEVLNRDGETHFLQSSIFEGDHHQIGLLFVPDSGINLSEKGLKYSTIINRDRNVIRKTDVARSENDEGREHLEKIDLQETEESVQKDNHLEQEEVNEKEDNSIFTSEENAIEENKEDDALFIEEGTDNEVEDEEDIFKQFIKKQNVSLVDERNEERIEDSVAEEEALASFSEEKDINVEKEEELSSSSGVENRRFDQDIALDDDAVEKKSGLLREDPFESAGEESDFNEIGDKLSYEENNDKHIVDVDREDDGTDSDGTSSRTEGDFLKDLFDVKETHKNEIEERRAEYGERPYGQAAGLEAFYVDFRKVSKEKDLWKELLEKDPNNREDKEGRTKKNDDDVE